ncbi:MAG: peptidase domain-containing ABC transporter [Eubacterium sp.]|nr:peptidase domain-containing ABC transporter [Eubacterium sp.]
MINKKIYPFVIQHDERDCGAACLSMIAEYYGKKLKLETCRELIKVDSKGTSIYGIIKGAEKIGLNAEAFQADIEDLKNDVKSEKIKTPIIVRIMYEDMYAHYCVVYKVDDCNIIIGNPADTKIRKIPIEIFKNIWCGQLITFEKQECFKEDDERVRTHSTYLDEIKKQVGFLATGLFASVLILFVNIAGAYLFRFILSDSYNSFYIFESIVVDGIEKLCVALVLLYVFRMLVEVIRCNIFTKLSRKLDLSITMRYYNHLIRVKPEIFDRRQTGDFMSRFYDTDKIRDALSSIVLSAILDTGMAIVCGVILYNINSRLFFISFITIIIYSSVVIGFKDIIKKTTSDVMSSNASVTSMLKESIDGIQTIKAYNLEEINIIKLRYLYERLTEKILKKVRIANMQNVITSLIASIGIVLVMGVGYKEYIAGVLSIADLFTFYYMMDYFMGPISGLVNLQPDIEAANIASERLNDIYDIEEESSLQEKVALNGDISFDSVTFRYGYDDPILENFNMTILEGSKVAIVGESGAGKTTIAKLILGFYTPEAGSISIGKTVVNKDMVRAIRNSVAYVSQETFLFEDSLYNNLIVGNPDIDLAEMSNILKKCGLMDYVEKLPYGYDTMISEGGKNLSGGQRQRIAIARALISKKRIIILDEATSNLDDALAENINSIIKCLSHDITCIAITHRQDTINCCDRIIAL